MASRLRSVSRLLRSSPLSSLPLRSHPAVPLHHPLSLTPLRSSSLPAFPGVQRQSLRGALQDLDVRVPSWGLRQVRQLAKAAPQAAAGKGDKALIEAVDAEIQHEKDSYEPPEAVAEGPPAPWTLEATPGAAEVVLWRSYQGEDIRVLLKEPVDFEEPQRDYEQEEQENEGDGERDVPQGEAYVPLTVSVTKKAADGTLKVLEIDAAIQPDGKFVVGSVGIKAPGLPEDATPYRSPDFLTLDEGLQDGFANYLHRRGVDENVATYARDLVFHKEQEEYEGWLGRVKEFLALKSA